MSNQSQTSPLIQENLAHEEEEQKEEEDQNLQEPSQEPPRGGGGGDERKVATLPPSAQKTSIARNSPVLKPHAAMSSAPRKLKKLLTPSLPTWVFSVQMITKKEPLLLMKKNSFPKGSLIWSPRVLWLQRTLILSVILWECQLNVYSRTRSANDGVSQEEEKKIEEKVGGEWWWWESKRWLCFNLKIIKDIIHFRVGDRSWNTAISQYFLPFFINNKMVFK